MKNIIQYRYDCYTASKMQPNLSMVCPGSCPAYFKIVKDLGWSDLLSSEINYNAKAFPIVMIKP